MTYRPTMAEAQAIGLCWLARAKGLPDINKLRVAVVQMHPETCGWCDYELPNLLDILRSFNASRIPFEDDGWDRLPARARREAIVIAQGGAA